ncbi:uncharacterized protein LOC132734165 [Ruditapes philippinarum]|uniref:uncharacterized protein LOC132734165 n=1 Tax=Ruditapes philippinarum TaxID=129788 RepID=UPI00295BF37C|nr:uncharacterized protein LOC132734165 [Ruditapes philippinarum]
MAVQGKRASDQFSSNEDLKVYCQPCDEEGTKLPAHGYCTDCKEHLCKTCYKAHKKHKHSKHHTLLKGSNMPKVLHQPSTATHTGKSDQLTTPCGKHQKEMIKFYCNDHEELLCSVCVTLEHQATSCEVDYIPDISDDIIGSKEYQVILKVVDTTSDQYQQIVEDVKKMTNKSNTSVKGALADINKFRQEFNQRLDELERQTKDAAKVIEQENNKQLKAVEATCEEITKSLKTSADAIKQLNTSKQADKLFMELKLAEKTLRDVERKTLQLSSFAIKELKFKAKQPTVDLLKTEKSLGTQRTINIKSQSAQLKCRQSSHQGEIGVKTSKDKTTCWITGMTLLTPDLVVITDHYNKAVKIVDTSSQSVSEQLQLGYEKDDAPWNITTVTSTELAVTLPYKQAIQFISVSSNKLKRKNTIMLDGHCYGISCNQGKLVVTYLGPAKLQILDMNGTILATIEGETIFQNPCYVTCNRCSIYVSDRLMQSVIRLNWQGDVIESYSDMGETRGISLSGDGTIFVCDRKRNVIEEISGDCSTGKIVLQGLNRPYTVCWSEETKMVYYSCDAEDKRNGNFLHSYKLSETLNV